MENRKYISAGKEFCTREKHVNAPMLRRKFPYRSCGKRATLEISAAGFYRAFINGKELTKGYFAPGITNPDELVYYDEYDVTDLLAEKNVICVLLGNGFNNAMDGGIWDFESAPFRSAPKLYLRIYDEDGTILTSDDRFKTLLSPITFDDLRAGERYDARLERKDSLSYEFDGEDELPSAVYVEAPKGEYLKADAEPVKAFERIDALSVTETEQGYVYDFGENNAGVYELNICGMAGQVLDLYFGEVFSRGEFDISSVMNDNRPVDYVQHDRYVLKDGRQKYTPSFTYHGYRYALIKGLFKEQAKKGLLKFVVLHSDVGVCGSFKCDDERVNKIQECTLKSDLSNLVGIPTDCPQREKNGWTADVSLSAEQFLYNLDCGKTLKSWHESLCRAQRVSGELPGIVPTAGWGFDWGNGPVWDSALIEIPYRLYRFYGDKQSVFAHIGNITRYLEYMKSKRNSDGLLAFGLGDWCETGSKLGQAPSTPLEVTDSLCCIDLADKAAYLAEAAGFGAERESFLRLKEEISAAFRKKWIGNARVHCATQTAQAFALHSGVFTEGELTSARKYLKELVDGNGGKFHVGVVGARYLFEELQKAGFGKTALDSIVASGFPSYKYWLDHGATTLWERFYRLKEEPGVTEREDGEGILSMNHHFWGSVSAWFYKYIGGLKMRSCGEAEISPDLTLGIGSAECGYKTKERRICVKWEKSGCEVRLRTDNFGFKGKIAISDYRFSDGEAEKAIPVGKNEFCLIKR